MEENENVEINYGRIAIIPKGDFSGSTQYEVGDLVSYQNSSYIAKLRPPLATLPTNTNYWQMAAGGQYLETSINNANEAANNANEAAQACEGIVLELNTMIDTVTHTACVLSIENGLLTIREA